MQAKNFVKGLIAGTVIGVTTATLINPPDANDMKRMNKGTSRAWATVGSTVGSIVDGVVGTFK